MRDRAIEFGERFGLLLGGGAASGLVFAILAVARGGGVLTTGLAAIPVALAVLAYVWRRQRVEDRRERRFVELNVELRKKEALLERLAVTDELTGLHNRRFFFERLDAEIDRAHRYGRLPSLVLVDLDHFKRINDTFGHTTGDAVLRETARVLRENVRETDDIARYGGEEFVLLLMETGLADASAVAEKLRAAVATHEFAAGGAALRVTISLGVAELGPGDDAAALVARADVALYDAKHGGRDRVALALPGPPRPGR